MVSDCDDKVLLGEKLTIYVDMDNTLVDLSGPWIQAYNEEFGDYLQVEDVVNYNVVNFVKCSKNAMFKILSRPGFFRNLPPKPDGVEVVRKLIEQGHNVYIATSPPVSAPDSGREKIEWIREHIPELGNKVILISHKWLLKGHVLIDDCPEKLEKFEGLTICMAMPYNVGCGVFRVPNWESVLRLFGIENTLQEDG